MKIKILVSVVFIFFLSGCMVAPYRVGGASGQQDAMAFAAEQATQMKTEGNKFMRNALSDEGACDKVVISTPSNIHKDAAISNRNGGVSFSIYYDGDRRITCD